MKTMPDKRTIGHFLFALYMCYADLIGVFPIYVRLAFWFGALFFIFCGNVHRLRFSGKALLIAVAAVFLVFWNNQSFARRDYSTLLRWAVRWFTCLIFIYIDSVKADSLKEYNKMIVWVAFPNAIATIFFWLVPSAYSVMHALWGIWPGGTSSLADGYHAGLTNHYSHNGIVCSFLVLALFSLLMEKTSSKKRLLNSRCEIVLFLSSFFALLLTAKRAHLLFTVATMVIIYYFCNPKKMTGRTFKIIIAGFAAVLLILAYKSFSTSTPELLARFETLGKDRKSVSRLDYWLLALRLWRPSKLLGIGWFGFRYHFSTTLYKGVAEHEFINAHNVYVQMLCETGILGLVCYLIVTVGLLRKSFKLLRASQNSLALLPYRKMLYLSTSYQVFYMLYSLTGNCLYDTTFHFYCVAASVTIAVSDYRYKKRTYSITVEGGGMTHEPGRQAG